MKKYTVDNNFRVINVYHKSEKTIRFEKKTKIIHVITKQMITVVGT